MLVSNGGKRSSLSERRLLKLKNSARSESCSRQQNHTVCNYEPQSRTCEPCPTNTERAHRNAPCDVRRSGTSTTVTSLYLDLAKPSFRTDLSGECAGVREHATTEHSACFVEDYVRISARLTSPNSHFLPLPLRAVCGCPTIPSESEQPHDIVR